MMLENNQSANGAEAHASIQRIGKSDSIYPMPFFKFKFSLGFITSCYVIFRLSMVQAMDIFMIT